MRLFEEKINIVLADDDRDECELFKEAVSEINENYNLIFFSNGKELMDYLNDNEIHNPDIIFLDLNMPFMSGVDCLRQIRADEKYSDTAIAIYSTSSSDQDQEDTFTLGANVYIKKPSDYAAMKKILQHIFKTYWQYHTSDMNRETFLISV
ncbi:MULTISPECIES: response regulator [Flavobacterium]|jgi:CheY-like chemotaxis protein|uniref:Response regulator receiver domain-containing protein n=1 Tax=Flavobacterium lindanitolerans TaxID=428988 RepID=A0A497USE6_9FLAO|nr:MULTISPECIES: response regulator [Flavobacterium]MBU7570841.1 response regulator [Flavobacterium sp.]PZO34426.1 MAG: response regulator [Flavobacteriaceae bacterium]PZQ83880.1 MAG: response regulator [Flavobacterium johnsoniae]KQS53496.1 transcriptional regulator [Flavobacterium sp. Leaf359]MBL7869322.1 response regulator [Flavobacterium lindanitolerans]